MSNYKTPEQKAREATKSIMVVHPDVSQEIVYRILEEAMIQVFDEGYKRAIRDSNPIQ